MNIKEKWKKNTIPLWIGQFLSLFGSGITQFAIIWHLTEATGSKAILAIATYMGVVPGILLGSYIGNFVDKRNKKTLMLISDLISAILIVIVSILFYFKIQNILIILIVLLLRSICSQIQNTSLFASIPLLVPVQVYENVGGIRQTIEGLVNLFSIPVAAILLSFLDINQLLLIDPITAIIGVILLLLVKFDTYETINEIKNISFIKKLINGFQVLYSYKYVFRKAIISSVINLTLTPAITFLPLLVSQYYEGGPKLLAILQTSAGVGIALGGLLMSIWNGFTQRVMTLLVGDLFLGLSLLITGIVAISNSPLLLAIPLFIAGFSLAISNSISAAISQTEIPTKDIGKVNGSSSSLSQLMIPIGLSIAIPISHIIGIIGWFIISGISNIVIAVIFLFDKSFLNFSLREVNKIKRS